MPGLNRKDPQGNGSMTGRRLGWCNSNNKGKTDEEILQFQNSLQETGLKFPGDGFGRGFGIHGLGLGRHSRFRGGV